MSAICPPRARGAGLALTRTTCENPCTRHLQGLSGPTGHGQGSCGRGRSRGCSALPRGSTACSEAAGAALPHTLRDELQVREQRQVLCGRAARAVPHQQGRRAPQAAKAGAPGGAASHGDPLPAPPRPGGLRRHHGHQVHLPSLWLPSCTNSDCSGTRTFSTILSSRVLVTDSQPAHLQSRPCAQPHCALCFCRGIQADPASPSPALGPARLQGEQLLPTG